MKDLRGYTKRYFSLAIIAMFSTLHKLSRVRSNLRYHTLAYVYHEYKTSPPLPC